MALLPRWLGTAGAIALAVARALAAEAPQPQTPHAIEDQRGVPSVPAPALSFVQLSVTSFTGRRSRGVFSQETSFVQPALSPDMVVALYRPTRDSVANDVWRTNTCTRYLSEASCKWTAITPCKGQPRGPRYTNDAVADGSDGYMCCCEEDLWKHDENAVAETCGAYFESTQCDWTARYPCADQFQTSIHAADANPSNTEGYTCCCQLDFWRKSLQIRLEHFREKTKDSAMCDRDLEARGCAWTDTTPCAGQPRTSSFQSVAHDDGSIYYKCCCDLEMWRTHGPNAALPSEELPSSVAGVLGSSECDEYFVKESCSWTARWPCAGQPHGSAIIREAGNDGSLPYSCCCERGYWRKDRSWRETPWRPGPDELMFIHIPKNAGTLVEEVSSQYKIWWPRKWLSFWHGADMPDGSTCEKYHVPPQYLRPLGEPDNDVAPFKVRGTFCITRHPYERAVSEYLYSLGVDWGPYMSNTYRTSLLGEPACTPEGLNHFLQSVLRKVEEGRKFLHDCHFVPQVDFIYGEDGYQWCKNVLRVDTLPHSFNQLMADHGYGPRIREEKSNNSTRTCDGNLTTAALWESTRLMLDRIYHNDFVKLNYSKGTL